MRKELTATEIRKEGYRVRVAIHNGKPMFASVDLLKVCGYKCPHERILKIFNTESFPGIKTKLPYQTITAHGCRSAQMCFFDREAAVAAIESSSCKGEARDWLTKEVLTYGCSQNETSVDEPAETLQETSANEIVTASITHDEINRIIDRALIELVELKKKILCQ